MALDIQRGIIFKAQKVVVYGPEGIGKSTFAARFPEPLFIDSNFAHPKQACNNA